MAASALYFVIPKAQVNDSSRVLKANDTAYILTTRHLDDTKDWEDRKTRAIYGIELEQFMAPLCLDMSTNEQGDLIAQDIFPNPELITAAIQQWVKNKWLSGPTNVIYTGADHDDPTWSFFDITRVFNNGEAITIDVDGLRSLPDDGFRLLNDIIKNP